MHAIRTLIFSVNNQIVPFSVSMSVCTNIARVHARLQKLFIVNTRSNHKPRLNNSDTCLGWEGDNCFKEVTMHLTISMEPYNNPNRKVLLSRAQLQECISGILHSKITRRVYCQKIPIRNSLFLTTLA